MNKKSKLTFGKIFERFSYGCGDFGCNINKIGNGIGSALLGLILEIGGYVGTAAVQTESALTSIKVCFVWIPIIVYACGLVIMKFYHLDKEFDGIIADLKARAQK